MARSIACFLSGIVLLTGCTNAPPPAPNSGGKPAAGVKVDVPGVNVNIEKDKGVQVNVAPKE